MSASNNEILKTFARNLNFLMEQHGMNGVELARRIDVEKQSVYLWLHGKSFPSVTNLQKIVSALDATTDELLSSVRPDGCCDVEIRSDTAKEGTEATVPLPAPVRQMYPDGFVVVMDDDSMNLLFPEGSYVLSQPCSPAEPAGGVYSLAIEGKPTCKQVRTLSNGYLLSPLSTDPTWHAQTIDFSTPDCPQVEILGRAVWFMPPFRWSC